MQQSNARFIPMTDSPSPFALFDISYSPDDDTSSNPAADGSSNPAADGSSNPEKTNAKSDDSRERAIRRDAERRAMVKYANKLIARGAPDIRDANGELDIEAIESAYDESLTKRSAKSAKGDDDDTETETDKAVRAANARAEAAERRANELMVETRLNAAMPASLFSQADCRRAFLEEFRADVHGGEVRVYKKDNTRARNEKGELATLEEVVADLIAKNQHWIKAEHRGEGNRSTHIMGNGAADTSKMTPQEKREYALEKAKSYRR